MAKSLREEHTERTKKALLKAAWSLFCKQGYDATSLDAVAKKARVTKGAVYHHYSSKKKLFQAIYEKAASKLAGEVAKQPIEAAPGSHQRLFALMKGFLTACQDAELLQITFVDGPAVLGPEACREVDERYALGKLREELGMWLGETPTFDLNLLVHTTLSMMIEFSQQVATAERPEQVMKEALSIWKAFVQGLHAAKG